MSENKHKEEESVANEQVIDNQEELALPESPEVLELTEESESAEEAEDSLTAKLDELQKKHDALNGDYLRLMADFDNFRKRTLKEKAELLKNGGESAIVRLLPVVDDFERALAAVQNSEDIVAVKDGVDLIYKKFCSYLDMNGVKEITAVGEVFDTEVHEAITTFPAPTPEQKGRVIDCTTKGYRLNDKVIRFAKVVVGE